MITIPLYYILILYIAYIIVLFIFYLLNLKHITHTGAITFASFAFTFFISAAVIIILYFTISLLINVDWMLPITVWNNDWISNTLTLPNF